MENCAPDKLTSLSEMWYVSHERTVDKRWAIPSTAGKNSGGGTGAEYNPGLPGGIGYVVLDPTAWS